MTASQNPDEPEEYHPTRNVSPAAVARAMSMLDSGEMEAMNQTATGNNDLADDGRVLVEVSQQTAEYVRRHAWTLDRDPGTVLDDLVAYAQIHHEDALDEYGENQNATDDEPSDEERP